MKVFTKLSIFLLLILLITSVFSMNSNAQCKIEAKADKIKICEGEPVTLSSQGDCDDYFMNNDFNNGTVGAGWTSTSQAMFNNPCGPGPDGSICFWMGTSALNSRFLETVDFKIPNSATIRFDMRYAIQARNAPCEGPDLPNEGVHLQYSVNSGITWKDLTSQTYWDPVGGNNPTLTTWNTYTIDIPAYAQTNKTRFRWRQFNITDAGYDHWGIDNVQIFAKLPAPTVLWSHGPTVFNPPVVYPKQTTTYIVTITNGFSSDSDSVTVIVNPQPIGNPLEKFTICSGTEIKIGKPATNGTLPYTYKWTPSSGLSDDKAESPSASPNETTLYIRSIIDSNGCKAIDSVLITVNPLFVFDAGVDIYICSGEEVSIGQNPTGGTPPFKYFWTPSNGLSSTAIAQPKAKPTKTTKYLVEIIDANGCIVNDSILITVRESPIISFPDEYAICAGENVNIGQKASNDDGTFTNVWSPATALSGTNQAIVNANPVVTTLYKLKVTSSNGCIIEKNVLVKIEPIPNAVAGRDALLCYGDSIKIGGDAFCGVSPFKYEWTPTIGLSDPNISSPIAKPLQTTKYTVKVTDGINRNGYDTVLISVNPELVLKAGGKYGICSNDSVSIGLEASGGTKPYKIEWSPSSGLSSPDELKTIAKPKTTTKYFLKLTDANNCQMIDSTVVEVYPLPSVFAGNDDTICAGSPIVIGNNATGGTPEFTYDWEPKLNIDDSKIAKPTVRPVKTTDYIVTVTDKNGCKAYDTVRINITPIPTANPGRDTFFCLGESAVLGGDAYCGLEPYTYKWSPSEGLSAANIATPKATPTATTTYKVVVTDALNRSDSATVTITVNSLPEIKNLKDVDICFGSTVQIGDTAVNGKPPYVYLWNPSEGLSSSIGAFVTANPTQTTKYKLTVIDDNGCVTSKDITVKVNPNPVVEILSDKNVCVGKPVKIASKVTSGSPPFKYTWIPTDEFDNYQSDSPTISLYATSILKLMVEDSKGCQTTTELKIDVLTTQATVSLPILESSPKIKDLHIPVNLNSEKNLINCSATEFLADITMDATIFNPVSITKGTFKKILIDSCRWRLSIAVPADNSWSKNKVITEIVGDVLLGERISTPLKFEKIEWKGVSPEPEFIDGELKLTDICKEGGDRLVDYGVCKLIVLSPNPADNEINAGIEIGEPGVISIQIFSSFGFCVYETSWLSKVDRNRNQLKDNRTINIPLSLPSGAYNVILRSVGGIDSKSLIIAR